MTKKLSLRQCLSLMYAMVNIQPNIAHAIGAVSIFMKNPSKEYWEPMKWTFKCNLIHCIILYRVLRGDKSWDHNCKALVSNFLLHLYEVEGYNHHCHIVLNSR